MLTAIITVLLTFVLTGLTGGRLIQAWQHRNWKRQQLLLDVQNEYTTLQNLFDEFASHSERRRNRMHRLLLILRRGDPGLIKKRLSEYDDALASWNDRFLPLQAKLTIHLSFQFAARLQDDIQPRFVKIGERLESMTRRRLEGGSINGTEFNEALHGMRHLSRELFRFNRDVLKAIKEKRNALYLEVPLNAGNLHDLPTWELFKALFKPWV